METSTNLTVAIEIPRENIFEENNRENKNYLPSIDEIIFTNELLKIKKNNESPSISQLSFPFFNASKNSTYSTSDKTRMGLDKIRVDYPFYNQR